MDWFEIYFEIVSDSYTILVSSYGSMKAVYILRFCMFYYIISIDLNYQII